jgi:aspartate aminotransferase
MHETISASSMANHIASRLSKIEPSPTLAITAMANQLKADGKDVVGFGAGEPDFDTPDFIKDAAISALKNGKTKYTDVAGIKSLREAVVLKMKRDHNLEYTTDQVVIGVGGKQVLYNTFMSILEPGDEVIIPGPYWVSYKDIVVLSEGTPIIVDTSYESGFKMTPEQLERALNSRTRAVILNSPSNPTGVAYSKEELIAFAGILKEYPDAWIISDDMYEKIIYDNLDFYNIAMVSAEIAERTIVVNGLSKAYSMTGWRLGYAAAKQTAVIKAVVKLQGQSTSNATSFAQAGGEAALRADQSFVKPMVAAFLERRDFLVNELNKMPGIRCHKPEGAFYVFPDFTGLTQLSGFRKMQESSLDEMSLSKLITRKLLEDKMVAVVPGIAFGYDRALRLSYASSMEQLKKGMERMNSFFQELAR